GEARTRLSRLVEKGTLGAEAAEAALSRLSYASDLAPAAESDFVIEAIVERLEDKRALFADLDRRCPPHAILATNSSSIMSSRLADATGRPERVLNMHFFNPPLVMELVEVVQGPHVAPEAAEAAVALARRMGKTPVLLRKEVPGFLVNRILGALIDEAMRLLEQGVASHAEIDMAVKKGLRHPMGPFELVDFNGVDVAYLTRLERYRETGDERMKPPKVLEDLYRQGRLGRKAGKGFYDYPVR
ncbi:MAG: 3-hydroxyacyl-CoA dehydrogenase family protein, partial [Armatimonadetes bacterium]|nr:3-hydroxyacyl-CoA dehydrogenase family protein [Armatimonadota bacterium]